METLQISAINGYSRTGKSTVARELVKQGWVEASTSDYLTLQTLDYYDLPESKLKDFLNKDNDNWYYENFGLTTREMKIHVAENSIVPVYGRYHGLVLPTVKLAFDKLVKDKSRRLLISTVNKEEYQLFLQALAYLDPFNIDFKIHEPVYIDRHTALKGVDLREPFGKLIDNNGSLSDTMKQIEEHLL